MVTMSVTNEVAHEAKKLGVHIVTRAEWGSKCRELYQERRRTHPHDLLPEKPVDTIWQHITDTAPSRLNLTQLSHDRALAAFCQDVRLVERIGLERFGTGMSYNFAVDMARGFVAIGQPLDAAGAHTLMRRPAAGFSYDQNKVSLAIAVIGRAATRLELEAQNAIAKLIAACINAGAATYWHDYKPHNFADPGKSCPCQHTQDAMPEIHKSALRLAGKERPKP